MLGTKKSYNSDKPAEESQALITTVLRLGTRSVVVEESPIQKFTSVSQQQDHHTDKPGSSFKDLQVSQNFCGDSPAHKEDEHAVADSWPSTSAQHDLSNLEGKALSACSEEVTEETFELSSDLLHAPSDGASSPRRTRCANKEDRTSVGECASTSATTHPNTCENCGQELQASKSTPQDIQASPSYQSINTCASSTTSVCRICLEIESSNDLLIAPCRCKGSSAYVHRSCLEKWIKSSDHKYCELCGFHFAINSKLKPITKWQKLSMSTNERRKLLCSVMFHVIAISCVVWSLYVLIEKTAEDLKSDRLQWQFWTKLVVVAIGFTGGLVFMYVQCKMYLQLFQRLKAFNQIIYVQDQPPITPGENSAPRETTDNSPSTSAPSSRDDVTEIVMVDVCEQAAEFRISVGI